MAVVAMAAIVMVFVVFGYEGRRVAQLMLLALPVLVWLAWPLRSPGLLRARAAIAWAWAMLFVVDGSVRAYLLNAYQAAPDSAFILGAVANTGAREGGEYFASQWRALGMWFAAVAVASIALWRLVLRTRAQVSPAPPKLEVAVLAVVCLAAMAAYASKPWRRLHPVAAWSGWAVSVGEVRAAWQDEKAERDEAHANARRAAPQLVSAVPSTVVLVISDSVNRDNLSLYGYGRATTPRLSALKEAEGDRMLVLRHAWSADASTLPALRNMMHFGEPDRAGALHLLALAKAAGYRTWWMGNHDDMAVDQQHARLADEVELINRRPGRSNASLDGELLDCLQEALQAPGERKFIVVHLQGAHPHYGQRFPSEFNSFDDAKDKVEASMVEQGRSVWSREFRQAYDAALLYHDFVVAEMMSSTVSLRRAGERSAFVYLSDHGQEVGHVSDRAGHSPGTESGYRIPAIVWRSDAFASQDALAVRPFRADWLGWAVTDLLGIRWRRMKEERNFLDTRYEWARPTLPFLVKDFAR
jgi:heptose-I-phosphate ethanolaminephosphotransferase